MPLAQVTIIGDENGVTRQTTAAAAGTYTIALLPPGVYRVTVVHEGFRPIARSGVELQVNQVARLDFSMEVGAMNEKIEVVANAPLLDSDTSSLGQVIDQTRIESLPLNGRMTFRLVQLTPGVSTPSGSSGQFGDISVGTFDDSNISINGGRSQSNAVLIDGVPANTGFLNLFTTIPSVDATQEFKVQSNGSSAEYGRFGGGVLNVSTRSGTNQLHGTLFEFLRNSIFDSNDFFNNRAGRSIPAFRMNQFGVAAGGPVRLGRLYNGSNRTFFFTNYEGTRWRRGAVFQDTVPTLAQRQGDFSQTFNAQGQLIAIYDPGTTALNPAGGYTRTQFPGNVIPKNRIDPVGAAILQFYPLPNLNGDPVTHASNYISNVGTRVNKDDGSIRVDQNVTDKYRAFARFAMTVNQLHQPDTFSNPATPGVGANGDILFHYYTGSWDNTFTASPTRLFNIRYGFARFFWARQTRSYGFDQNSLGFPSSYTSQLQIPVFPSISTEGYASMAGGSFIRTGQDTHSLLPSMTQVIGRHTLKIGADIRLRRNNVWVINNGGGQFGFTRNLTTGPNPSVFAANAGNGVASLLLGTGASGVVNTVPGASLQNFYLAGYVQDDVTVSHKLTLNLGLRYETETPYTERRDKLAYFNANAPSPVTNAAFPDLKGAVEFVGTKGASGYPYDWDRNNLSPRIGLAWSPRSRLVLRSAFGVFFAGLETSNDLNNFTPESGTTFSGTTAYLGTLDTVTPFRYVSNPFPTGLVSPLGTSGGPAGILGQSISTWDRSGRTPYNLQWNGDVQYQLTNNLLVDAAYAGSRGVHFARTVDLNALNPQYLSLGTQLTRLVPNPFVGQIATGTLSQPLVAQSQLLKPYPQYTSVNILNSPTADSIYHSVQLKLEQRFSRGQTILLSFTGAKLIEDSNNSLAGLGVQANTTGLQNPYNLRAERSLSEQDQARVLAISYVSELPFGKGRAWATRGLASAILGDWTLSSLFSYKGGFPLAINAPITGGGNRPNSTGMSARLPNGRTRAAEIQQWFDTGVFLLPPSYTYGNVSRTLPDTRGPSTTNIDLSLVRNIRFLERLDLQVRGEAFNLLNTPHFAMPITNLASVQFGQITGTQIAGLPRVMQFALKLRF